MKNTFLAIAVLAACTQSGLAQVINNSPLKQQPFSTPAIQQVVDSVYNRMTPNERLAQLSGIRPISLLDNGKLSLEKCRKVIPNGIGHISQYACALAVGSDQLRDFVKELQNYLIKETPTGIPAIFHEEAITGVAALGATVYPQQIGVACTWDTKLAAKKTEQTAEAMRSIGGSLALSPMVDVIRSAYWPRLEESYGEDGYLAARMGVAFVDGLQKKGLRYGVAACSKHFLAYGSGKEVNNKELVEEYLFPHEAMIRQGNSKVVMTGYHQFRGKNTVSSDTLLKEILRKYIGFDGIVVSDYSAVSRQWTGNTPKELKGRAVAAINAGNDLEFSDPISYPYLPEAIKDSLVTEKRFEEAVKRALTLKANLGLLDKNPVLFSEGKINIDRSEYRKTAYDLACESVVLLKNNGILPLQNKQQKVALVGPNANTFWCLLGDYTYQSMYSFWWGGKVDPNNPKLVSLREALQNKLDKKVVLSYERGCDWSSGNEAGIIRAGDSDPRTKALKLMLMQSADATDWKKAIEMSANSDVIIAAVGENPTLCGEGRERKGIRLPGDQEKFVNELIATGKPIVLVVFGGRSQVLGDIEQKCAAVLQAWDPGEEGGNAVADLLLGNVNPSGKLCVSYPKTESKNQVCYNDGTATADLVSHPFGYGLSYTTFKYDDIQVSKKISTNDKRFTVSCTIQNTGKISGTEIVQLYLSPTNGQPLKPIQLKGFERVILKSGEKKKVIFTISPQVIAHYSNANWTITPGKYELKIGASSEDIRLSKEILLEGKPVNKVRKDVYFSESTTTL